MLPQRISEINNRVADLNKRLVALKNSAIKDGDFDMSHLSSEEREAATKLMAEKKDLLAEHKNFMAAHEALDAFDAGEATASQHARRDAQGIQKRVLSFADAFMAHEQFKPFLRNDSPERLRVTGYAELPQVESQYFTFDPQNNLFDSSASQPARLREADRVRIPLRPGIVFDLFPRIPMAAKTIEWEEGTVRALQTATNAQVGEGAGYAEMNIQYPVRQARAQDMAVFQGVTADQLQDKPGLRQTLDADLDDFLAEQFDLFFLKAPAIAAEHATLGSFPGGVFTAATDAPTQAVEDVVDNIIATETRLIGTGRRAPNVALVANSDYGRLKGVVAKLPNAQTGIISIMNGVIMIGEVAVYRATGLATNEGLVGYTPHARARFRLDRQTRITDQQVVNTPRVPSAGLAPQQLYTLPTGRFNIEAIIRAVPQVMRSASFAKMKFA